MPALLESRGYSCAEADHGAMALEWLEMQHADLVITDGKMPVMGGFEFLGCLMRKNQSCPSYVNGCVCKQSSASPF
jgi:CheY-like chemotaxis protein